MRWRAIRPIGRSCRTRAKRASCRSVRPDLTELASSRYERSGATALSAASGSPGPAAIIDAVARTWLPANSQARSPLRAPARSSFGLAGLVHTGVGARLATTVGLTGTHAEATGTSIYVCGTLRRRALPGTGVARRGQATVVQAALRNPFTAGLHHGRPAVLAFVIRRAGLYCRLAR
jgi:hypothetical protein